MSEFYTSWELKKMIEELEALGATKEEARCVAFSGLWTPPEGGDSRDEA